MKMGCLIALDRVYENCLAAFWQQVKFLKARDFIRLMREEQAKMVIYLERVFSGCLKTDFLGNLKYFGIISALYLT